MSIGYCYVTDMGAAPYVAVPPTDSQPLHRLAAVRRQQGVSRHAVARRLKIDVEQVRQQESESSDLPLSTLYAWQNILDVPIAELLVEPGDGLPSSILMRSQLLRLMKTVQTILEKTKQESVRRMAQTMVGQLVEIMPELADVGAWNIGGRQRRRSELGVAAQRRLADEVFVENDDDDDYAQLYASLVGDEPCARRRRRPWKPLNACVRQLMCRPAVHCRKGLPGTANMPLFGGSDSVHFLPLRGVCMRAFLARCYRMPANGNGALKRCKDSAIAGRAISASLLSGTFANTPVMEFSL